MKKLTVSLISTVLIALLGVCCVIPTFAEETGGDQYLPDFVIEIADGSDDTLGEINTIDRYQRAYEGANITVGAEYFVNFKSGGSDHTHQYICANALRILANDKGDSLLTQSSNASLVLEGADYPDTYDMGVLFNTHFYNPYTETSYMGSTTAKDKAQSYYNEAVSYYKNGNISSAMSAIGRGSHFVQDACEAHHVTNKTAVNSNHSAYESYVDNNRTKYSIPGNTLDSSVYEEAKYCTAGQIVRNNGFASYGLSDKVTGDSSNPDYDDAARATTCNAMISTTQYFYKFCVEVGLM